MDRVNIDLISENVHAKAKQLHSVSKKYLDSCITSLNEAIAATTDSKEKKEINK